MSKVRLLILSSFASGFGLCSIVFSVFTMASELSFGTMFRFLLTLIFFGINLLFTVHYYALMLRDFKRLSRAQNQIQQVTTTF
ncbi:hypothetical protein [Lyngbya sp. PCC 8106]|uniref:hypothetical protein n=1 Tax=Lyngbya sp. (strain PCC 8106) TaxID=313612 RepID=UPI0000EA9F68|nr:hypothetical protein [Lyngbya sp. PCC 8106]EAW36709.1 hypothetical protein L8106_29695 [Lyngbya sp. PCC 8106]